MMLPMATSATILIIPLILNTLSAPPPPQTRAAMAAAPETFFYQIADQPQRDLGSWVPPVDICSSHFDIANTTHSSVLVLLLFSLPGLGGQPVHHRGCNNSTSHPLEPGSYGAPRQSVCSNPYGLNVSLDVGLLSLTDSSVLAIPPMIGIDERQIDVHSVGAPAFYAFVLCSSDGNGSFIPSIFQDGPGHTTKVWESISAVQPRKLLGSHSTNLRRHDGQVLVSKKPLVRAAAIAIGAALLAVFCTIAGFLFRCARNKLLDDESTILQTDLCPLGPRRYSYKELADATGRFSDEGKIGRGGFGPVYRGYLPDQGNNQLAIKVLSQGSNISVQGVREFQAEVNVMTRLRHRNIVQLLGWSDGPGGLMLVYEFVPKGSLDKHLYHSHRTLTWPDRYKVALGVGSAILYLHTECDQCILHGDIKPANILLDSCCNAKLGDFGLARLVDHGIDSHPTQVVAGTLGYMDPEFVNNGTRSVEADIYSFGVVLLEIAAGRRPTARDSHRTSVLLTWIREMYRENSILGAADQRLEGEFDEQQMRRVLVMGLWCTHPDQSQRPSIAQAMDLLRRQDVEMPVLDLLMIYSPDVVSPLELEEIAHGDVSTGASAVENSSDDTAYHSANDSTVGY